MISDSVISQWSAVSSQQSAVSGQQSVVSSQQSAVSSQWSLVNDHSLVTGKWLIATASGHGSHMTTEISPIS